MPVGFIGTGHVAAPMARALARHGHDVHVTRRNQSVSRSLVKSFPQITVATPQTVLDACDTVFLTLRPNVAEEILTELDFRVEHEIISAMATISLKRLAALCAPATRFARTIPFGFLERGGCPLPVFPASGTLTRLFGALNIVIPLNSEEALDRHFATSSLIPAVLQMMGTTRDWLVAQGGDAQIEETYVRALIGGFLADLGPRGDLSLDGALGDLATKGTLSLQMVENMIRAGAPAALCASLDDIAGRSG